MIKLVVAVLICVLATTSSGSARPSYHYEYDRHSVSQDRAPVYRAGRLPYQAKSKARSQANKKSNRARHKSKSPRIAPIIVAHPAGCPRTRFCGCGASIKVFNKNDRSLWLAKNWFRFPASDPGPMKVAVRVGHVFVILKVLDKNKVLAYDANSGGRKTRIHVRSLAGYSVRDPMGKTRLAAR